MSRQGVIAVVLVVVALGLLWWLFGRIGEPAPEPPAVEPGPAPVGPETTRMPGAEPEPLPPLEASDALARDVLVGAGVGDGGLAASLEQEHLIRRFVAAVAAVAQGKSPRPQIGFLEPGDSFRAQSTADGLVVDPRSFARYEPVVAAIGALDTGFLVAEYVRLEPLFQAAYAELGVEGPFRTVLLQAMDLLLATPVPAPPMYLEDRVEVYVYADPALQELAPAQKHLLRLGPENQRIVQTRLRDLRAALVS